MNEAFNISGTSYYRINDEQKNAIVNIFNNNSGLYEVPNNIWQNELIDLPSPIRSVDCYSVYTSGTIDISTTTPEVNIMDIIRQESNPQPSEPEYNVYRHHIVTSGTNYFISAPVAPDHHWSTSGDLNRVYGF